MKYLFLLLIIISVIEMRGQNSDEGLLPGSTVRDSLMQNYKPSINELKQILSSGTIKDPYSDYIESQVLKITDRGYTSRQMEYKPLRLSPLKSFNSAKKHLLHSISLQPKLLNAGDLGILGDIFLYANAAAAGYALYMHLKKYGDEY